MGIDAATAIIKQTETQPSPNKSPAKIAGNAAQPPPETQALIENLADTDQSPDNALRTIAGDLNKDTDNSADLGTENRQPLEDGYLSKLGLTEEEAGTIQGLVDQLEKDFEAISGKSLKDALSGDISSASEGNSFLFKRAISEADPARRRELILAHIALDLKHNQTPRIKSAYGDGLGKDGKTPLRDIFPALYRIESTIPSGTEIAKGMSGEKLRISNEGLVDQFVQFSEYYQQIYDLLEGQEMQPGISRQEVAAVMAAQRTAVEYFGMINEHTASRNIQRYRGNIPELSDFKTASSAVCTENAALTQQLLSFAGLKTMLISGGPLVIGENSGEFPPPEYEGHVYNIIYSDKPFVYDPSNPIWLRNQEDPSQTKLKIYLAPLDEAQTSTLYSGKDTYLNYANTHRLYSLV